MTSTTIPATANYSLLRIRIEGKLPANPAALRALIATAPIVAWAIDGTVPTPVSLLPPKNGDEVEAIMTPSGIIIELGTGGMHNGLDAYCQALNERWPRQPTPQNHPLLRVG